MDRWLDDDSTLDDARELGQQAVAHEARMADNVAGDPGRCRKRAILGR